MLMRNDIDEEKQRKLFRIYPLVMLQELDGTRLFECSPHKT